MQAPAIDDHISTKLYAWYTIVAAWEPPGVGFTGICTECSESALACTIDVAEWPHDVIHPLVQSLRSAIADVQNSYCEEESSWESAAMFARNAVSDALSCYAGDIMDVLEECLSERLQAYLTAQAEAVEWEFRRPAAS